MSLVLSNVSGHSSYSMSRIGEEIGTTANKVAEGGGVPTLEEGS